MALYPNHRTQTKMLHGRTVATKVPESTVSQESDRPRRGQQAALLHKARPPAPQPATSAVDDRPRSAGSVHLESRHDAPRSGPAATELHPHTSLRPSETSSSDGNAPIVSTLPPVFSTENADDAGFHGPIASDIQRVMERLQNLDQEAVEAASRLLEEQCPASENTFDTLKNFKAEQERLYKTCHSICERNMSDQTLQLAVVQTTLKRSFEMFADPRLEALCKSSGMSGEQLKHWLVKSLGGLIVTAGSFMFRPIIAQAFKSLGAGAVISNTLAVAIASALHTMAAKYAAAPVVGALTRRFAPDDQLIGMFYPPREGFIGQAAENFLTQELHILACFMTVNGFMELAGKGHDDFATMSNWQNAGFSTMIPVAGAFAGATGSLMTHYRGRDQIDRLRNGDAELERFAARMLSINDDSPSSFDEARANGWGTCVAKLIIGSLGLLAGQAVVLAHERIDSLGPASDSMRGPRDIESMADALATVSIFLLAWATLVPVARARPVPTSNYYSRLVQGEIPNYSRRKLEMAHRQSFPHYTPVVDLGLNVMVDQNRMWVLDGKTIAESIPETSATERERLTASQPEELSDIDEGSEDSDAKLDQI